jgi:membrane complex biogenesis BtpA family protein
LPKLTELSFAGVQIAQKNHIVFVRPRRSHGLKDIRKCCNLCCDFIRVCMFTGAGVWDAGSFDEGCAADLMRRRKELHAEHIKILADVDKKHSVRFPGIDLATHIEWTRFFGADALIVSGRMTGDAPDVAKVREAKQLAGDRPVIIGSGADEHNIAAFMAVADGVIVGSSIKQGGAIADPVDVARVTRFIAAARGAL